MSQTLALRKYISSQQQASILASINQKPSLPFTLSSNNGSTNFDVTEFTKLKKPSEEPAASCSILPGKLINFDAVNKSSSYEPQCVELVDSKEWLRRYGLKTNKLNLESILGLIGFKQSKDYVNQIHQMISSRYSKGLFLQTQSKDGYIYNITVNEAKLTELAIRLEESIKLFKMRLNWLNSDSRRLFGVIGEKRICIVIDCKNRDRSRFSQYKACLLRLFREQVAQIASFNIIRCSDKIELFQEKSVLVSSKSIEEALAWINNWMIDFKAAPPADTITTEAVLEAFKDDTIDAIYLISEGTSSNGSREILYDKLVKHSKERKISLNVISFNCDNQDTVEFLRRVAQNSFGPGRFHAYCLTRHYDDYVRGSIDAEPTKTLVIANQRMLGGAPPNIGLKSDVMLIYDEIEKAREAMDSVKAIIEAMNARNNVVLGSRSLEYAKVSAEKKQQDFISLDAAINEDYMSSAQWLKKFGISARNLDFFEFLRKLTFRHCDGVVDLMKEPSTGKLYFIRDGVTYYQGDSVPSPKLVNAKYCDQFAHVLWNDGTIMHVHVAPEMNRSYEEKMKILLDQIQKRIEWLSRGSRELFGTVIENRICILIDTSQSMQLSLEFVKNKLIALIQEQLRAKQRFNLLAFNSKVHPWRDRMVEVDEFNVLSAFEWINELSAQGTTNTLGALRFALADPKTEAIYLLSDGRPDQDPRQILSQIHLNTQIPIHTISFNCNDADANRFLSQLAKETDGRYHYFNENGWNADPNGPVPYESHDISLLKNEMETGLKYLSQLTKLREECALITKNKPAVVEKKLINSTFSSPEFTASSKSNEFQSKHRSKTFDKYKAMNSKNPVESTLGSLNEIQSLDWILPETRELLERQYKLQMSHHHSKSEIAFNATSSSSSTPLQQKPTEKKSVAKQIKPISADSSLLKSHSKIQTWLEKNSLSRLKLTIFDVLLSLSTKKKKKHDDNEAENLLIVNDLFEARVWNEILDSAQSSGIDKNRFKFINPASINLSDYTKKLENQIHVYKKYLADTIWKSLTDIERTVLDNQAPLEFDETNKESLLKGLQYCNWPIKQKDIEAVEKEIELAKRYLRLAQELSYYILGKVESGREKIVSVNRELDKEKEKEKEEKSPREDNNPLVSALISTRSSPRKLDKTEIDRIMSAPAKKEDFISRGDRVIARNDLLGYYFNGKVTKVSDSRHATVKFENGAKQDKMSFRNILKLNGPSPYISLGDYVMASVLNEFEQKCWVPGIVQLIDQNSFPKLYTILYFNGQEGENTRPELIKINKSAYGFIVNYIRGRLGLSGTSLRTFREDTKLPPPPEPKPLDPGGPEIDYLKKDIIDEIKSHFDSLKLDDKYQRMYDELVLLRKKQKNYKSDLEGKFKVLRNDFDEWRKQEPPVVLPNPNLHLYEKARDESSSKKVVVTSPPSSQRDASTTEQKIAKLRADLPELRPGEEVLAKWPDDGWYYRSIVKDYLGKYRYQVEDSLRDVEQIYREDIVSELHDVSDTFEEGDPVVALHPKYDFSYAPGQIVRVSSDMSKLLVKFYDYEESVVVRNEVYKLPRLKYQLDVTNIINLEKRWIGQTVVARNNFSNVYELGKVVNRVGNGRQYTIEWSNGKQSIQNANHIFGKYTRNQQILNNDYVLAPKETIFLPGRVLSQQGDQLRVKFVDGKIDENVSLQQCYWLSRDYYEDACNFYTQKNNADSDSDEGVKSNDDSDGSASVSRSGGGRRTPVIDANEFRAKKSTSSMISEKSSTTRIISSPSRPKTKGSSRRNDDDSDTFEAD